VLVAGGGAYVAIASVEIYDPATGTWAETAAMLNTRFIHTATLLPDGGVLVAAGAGFTFPPIPLSTAELFTPQGVAPSH